MKKNKPKCANCTHYNYDRIEDMYACTYSKYLVPTLMTDICSAWCGESDTSKRRRYEAHKRSLEFRSFPSAEERKLSF